MILIAGDRCDTEYKVAGCNDDMCYWEGAGNGSRVFYGGHEFKDIRRFY